MNKKFKKKIAILSAVLSIGSVQNSKSVSAANKNLIKGLAIGIPSVVLVAGLSILGVKYLKNKNNDQENKNPDGGIKLLEGEERQEAEKLMDDFINQEWILDKNSKCFCKCINYDGMKNNDNELKNNIDVIDYKNYLFGKNIEINGENIDDINNKAGYHIQKMAKSYNENKNIRVRDFCILKSMSAGCEILQFGVPDSIRIRVEYDKKSKKPLSLKLDFLNRNANDNINCHWYFKHKDNCE